MARTVARVLCVDHEDRVLLLRWRDPADGTYLWEPPGGGAEPGETPLETARRELHEETGLPTGAVAGPSVRLHRDTVWNGERHVGDEEFFLARFDRPPDLSRKHLEAYETGWLDSHAWVPWNQLAQLGDRLEPPELTTLLATLDPAGPWNVPPAVSPSAAGPDPR